MHGCPRARLHGGQSDRGDRPTSPRGKTDQGARAKQHPGVVHSSVVAASQLGNVGGRRVAVGKLNSAPAEGIAPEGSNPKTLKRQFKPQPWRGRRWAFPREPSPADHLCDPACTSSCR